MKTCQKHSKSFTDPLCFRVTSQLPSGASGQCGFHLSVHDLLTQGSKDKKWTDFRVCRRAGTRRHSKRYWGVLWYPVWLKGMFQHGWCSSKMLFTLLHSLCLAVSQLSVQVLGTRGSSATNYIYQLVVLMLTLLWLFKQVSFLYKELFLIYVQGLVTNEIKQ